MKKLYMVIIASAMLLSTGCAASAEPVAYTAKKVGSVTSSSPEVTVEQILYEYNSSRKIVEVDTEENEPGAPLAVAGCACRIGDSYILFPKVDCAAEEIINSAICTAVMERAEQLGIAVFADYKVEYNRNGIFSIRMFLYDMYGDNEACIDCIPLTFNSETGERYRISDFFDSENQNWRGRIPDIITAQAADFQMVLLSDIMPISDDRPFYITDEAVVIMYDLYEIATFSAGEPEFEIAVDDIAECLDDTSALNVMLQDTASTAADTAPAEGEIQMQVPSDEPAEQQPQHSGETDGQILQQTQGEENSRNTQDNTGVEQQTEPLEQTEAEPAVMSMEDEPVITEEIQ